MPTPADYLALAHAERDIVVLQRLAQCPYPFVWQALAANPHTPPVALQELSTARDSVWNDNRLLRLLAEHPGANPSFFELSSMPLPRSSKRANGPTPLCLLSQAGWSFRRTRSGSSATSVAPLPVCVTCLAGG